MRKKSVAISSLSLCFLVAACGSVSHNTPSATSISSNMGQAEAPAVLSIPKDNIVIQAGDEFVVSVPPHVAEYFKNGENGEVFNVGNEFVGEWITVEENFSPITTPENYPVPPELWAEPLNEKSAPNSAVSSSNRIVARKSEPAESFTKRTVSPQFMRRIGPQVVTAYGAGSYRFEVSAEGKVRLVKVSSGGEVNVKGGLGYTATKYACAYFQTEQVHRYIRFREYIYYSDGRKVATGAYHDQLQPALFTDSNTRRIGNWSVC